MGGVRVWMIWFGFGCCFVGGFELVCLDWFDLAISVVVFQIVARSGGVGFVDLMDCGLLWA